MSESNPGRTAVKSGEASGFERIAHALNQLKLPVITRVAFAMLLYGGRSGVAHPGITRLAKDCKTDKRTARRALVTLVDSGFLEVRELSTRRGKSTVYAVAPGASEESYMAFMGGGRSALTPEGQSGPKVRGDLVQGEGRSAPPTQKQHSTNCTSKRARATGLNGSTPSTSDLLVERSFSASAKDSGEDLQRRHRFFIVLLAKNGAWSNAKSTRKHESFALDMAMRGWTDDQAKDVVARSKNARDSVAYMIHAFQGEPPVC